jgi:hypothetical protein
VLERVDQHAEVVRRPRLVDAVVVPLREVVARRRRVRLVVRGREVLLLVVRALVLRVRDGAPGGLRGLVHVGGLLGRDLDVGAGARARRGLVLVGAAHGGDDGDDDRGDRDQAEDPAADHLEPLAPGGRGGLLALELHARLAARLLLLLTTGHGIGESSGAA